MKIQTLYKLTDARNKTRDNTQWGPGITHIAIGSPKQDLRSSGWIHAYESPLIAILMNAIHADFCNPRPWKARGKIGKRQGQLKCGCQSLTTIKEISLPTISANARVRFAILRALKVYQEPTFKLWAQSWLAKKDRSRKAAYCAPKPLA